MGLLLILTAEGIRLRQSWWVMLSVYKQLHHSLRSLDLHDLHMLTIKECSCCFLSLFKAMYLKLFSPNSCSLWFPCWRRDNCGRWSVTPGVGVMSCCFSCILGQVTAVSQLLCAYLKSRKAFLLRMWSWISHVWWKLGEYALTEDPACWEHNC